VTPWVEFEGEEALLAFSQEISILNVGTGQPSHEIPGSCRTR